MKEFCSKLHFNLNSISKYILENVTYVNVSAHVSKILMPTVVKTIYFLRDMEKPNFAG